jgi:hypothetical protein
MYETPTGPLSVDVGSLDALAAASAGTTGARSQG